MLTQPCIDLSAFGVKAVRVVIEPPEENRRFFCGQNLGGLPSISGGVGVPTLMSGHVGYEWWISKMFYQ